MSKEEKKFMTKMIHRYVNLSERHPWLTFLMLLVVTLLLGSLLPRIKVDTRIQALLPSETISMKSNEEASRRYAGSSPYFLVVQISV